MNTVREIQLISCSTATEKRYFFKFTCSKKVVMFSKSSSKYENMS